MGSRYESEGSARKEADRIRSYIGENPSYKPTAKDLTYIAFFPSQEVEKTFREMQRWVRKGLPPASSGNFLSSRINW